MTRDFTLDKYQELCETLQSSGYQLCNVYGYLIRGEDSGRPYAVLRHDVDRKIQNAFKMAELEAELGIAATYYFRYPSTFDIEIIGRVRDLGHEVGYHYEVLSKARGDYQQAINLFVSELAEFETICEVRTICMHGRPLSQFDNRDLWTRYDYRDYGIMGEAYLSMVGTGVRYLTDTGRSWSGSNSVRDTLAGAGPAVPVETTDDLMEWIGSDSMDDLYLTAHPERWAIGDRDWATGYIKDLVVNAGKTMLLEMRNG